MRGAYADAMSTLPVPIAGRVVAITGGARGLGLATAKALAARGARVSIGDLDGDLAQAEAALLPGGPHLGVALDVTDPEQLTSFLDETASGLGPLDVMINNAGIMPVAPFRQEDPATTRRQVEINLLALLSGTRLALDRMVPRGRGHVVNIASAAGRVAVPGEAVYTATKHAVVGFSEALHAELRGTGVEVTTVMPSLARTELAAGMHPPRFVPMVKPEQVASAIVDALEKPRLEVVIPSWTTPLIRMQLAMGVKGRDFLRRVFKIESLEGDMDPAARAAYVERTEREVAAETTLE
jgi:NAD(P)-dependent dehydrogenase (short-subunit alcohol dehydrogenase family)